jgi:hypothetical protein
LAGTLRTIRYLAASIRDLAGRQILPHVFGQIDDVLLTDRKIRGSDEELAMGPIERLHRSYASMPMDDVTIKLCIGYWRPIRRSHDERRIEYANLGNRLRKL